jgi:hypothetical protein
MGNLKGHNRASNSRRTVICRHGVAWAPQLKLAPLLTHTCQGTLQARWNRRWIARTSPVVTLANFTLGPGRRQSCARGCGQPSSTTRLKSPQHARLCKRDATQLQYLPPCLPSSAAHCEQCHPWGLASVLRALRPGSACAINCAAGLCPFMHHLLATHQPSTTCTTLRSVVQFRTTPTSGTTAAYTSAYTSAKPVAAVVVVAAPESALAAAARSLMRPATAAAPVQVTAAAVWRFSTQPCAAMLLVLLLLLLWWPQTAPSHAELPFCAGSGYNN